MLHFSAIPPEISYRVEILRDQRWGCIMDYFESEANGMRRPFSNEYRLRKISIPGFRGLTVSKQIGEMFFRLLIVNFII